MENVLGTVDLLVKRNVLRYPEKIASIYGEERLTYGEMNQRINGMINGLASLGIKKGDRVAIFSQNHGRYLEFLFGAAKGGFALCTINFMLKEAELVYILQHSEAKAIIYHSGYHDLVEEASTKCIFLKHKIAFDGSPPGVIHYEEMVASSSKEEPDVSIDSDDLLLLVYTSGTTGKPKGVMLSHYNIFFNALDSVTGVELEQDTINLNVCPLYHVAASVLQTYGTLYTGGTSVTMSHFDPREVLEMIERERVNFCFLVPTMIFRILELPDVKKYDLSSLRRLGYGAAPMPYDRLKKAIEVFGQVLFQGYGLTEGTANICILRPEDHILDGSEAQQKRLLSCGREHSNHQLRVFDDNNKEVKPGEVGEIVAKSPSVMKGYWKNPEATKNTIVNGWLHTGDMATIDKDRYIYIVDRKHDLIISGGENIYPKEVEEVLFSHPSVLEAAVAGVRHRDFGEVPKAFVALRKGATATESELIQFCKEHLAGYKCPKSVMFLDELPKTASGKITRAGIQEKYVTRKERS
ncbi:MAG: long-chain fatty acid--CoA ligase [Desulfatiglandales bacterium]